MTHVVAPSGGEPASPASQEAAVTDKPGEEVVPHTSQHDITQPRSVTAGATDDAREPDPDDYDPGEDCGRWINGMRGRYCALAGTEFCDFKCPYRDAETVPC